MPFSTLPKRRKKPRRKDPKRNPAHLQFVRGHECVAKNSDCSGKIRACHMRTGTDGGTGTKPSDRYTFPACDWHHDQQHRLGEATFQKTHAISLREITNWLWFSSPHRHKSEDAA